MKKLIAIIALAAIEIVALMKGIDSGMLVIIVGVIAGLGGYEIGKKGS